MKTITATAGCTQYIKDLPESGTSVSVSYYRYTSSGYFNFSDANQKDISADDRLRDEAQFTVSQSLFSGISFYASGSQQKYWDRGGRIKTCPSV